MSSVKVWSRSSEISAFGVCFSERTFGCVGGMERDVLTEQRTNIKFLVKLGKNGQEFLHVLEMVYGESAMKRITVYKWVDLFKEGRESVDDDARAGRPSTSRVDENIRVYDLVKADRRITTRMIAEKLGISNGSVQTILKEALNMRKLCAKIVPKILTDEQKQGRVDCCNDWIESAQDPHFHERVITGDEAWIYEYDPETKRQSEEWKHPGSPRTKKARKSRSKIKTMLIIFFEIRGVIHHEYVPAGRTVNAKFKVEVLKRLREHVRRARPELWAENAWILHQDNAPSDSALDTHEFLAKIKITTMEHPPCSPDLAPCDFCLFPKVKKYYAG